MQEQERFLLQDQGERSMLTTWKLSYDQVLRQSEAAAWLLRLWAFFHHDDFWYGLLAKSGDIILDLEEGEEFKLPNWLTKLAENELDFSSAMGLLKAYSMADSRGEGSYTMHSVLHQWSRSLSLAADSTSLISISVCVLASASPRETDDKSWELDRRLQQHVLHASNVLNSAQTLVQHDLPSGATHELGDLLKRQGKTNQAEQMYQRALTGYEKVYRPNYQSTSRIMNNLGLVYLNQGKLDGAEQMFERALASEETALGPNHSLTLETVNNLGDLCIERGQLEKAEKMLQRALAGREKILGPNHTSTLQTLNGLGVLYAQQGKPDEAEQMFQRTLAGREEALGSNHPSTLKTIVNLGKLYCEEGRLEESGNQLLRALAGHEKLFGRETSTPPLLTTVYNLGLIYYEQEKLDEAEQMFERALIGYQQAHGCSHQRTTKASKWLAFARSKIGKFFYPASARILVPQLTIPPSCSRC